MPKVPVRTAKDFLKSIQISGSRKNFKDAQKAFRLLGGDNGEVERIQAMAKMAPYEVPLLVQVGANFCSIPTRRNCFLRFSLNYFWWGLERRWKRVDEAVGYR